MHVEVMENPHGTPLGTRARLTLVWDAIVVVHMAINGAQMWARAVL